MAFPKKTVIAGKYEIKHVAHAMPRGGFYQADRMGESRGKVLLRLEPAGVDDVWHEPDYFDGLEHPGVGQLVDSGTFPYQEAVWRYLAFEWIAGENLAALLAREGDLEVGHAFSIALDVMETLEFLHANPVRLVVLCVQPECIWLDYSEGGTRTVLVDLQAAARAGSSEDSPSVDGIAVFYRAPEVSRGLAVPQSDVFSVATLVFRLIYGLPPWFVEGAEAGEPVERESARLGQLRSRTLDFSKYVHPLLDEHFVGAMRRALDVSIEARYRTIAEFREVLRRDRKVKERKEPGRIDAAAPRRSIGGHGFSGVAGMDDLKQTLRKEVIDALEDRERYRSYGLTIPNGMLLYGPPGCGKTFIATKFAEEADYSLVHVKRSDVASIYVDGSVEKIKMLFDTARETAPSILFLDEFEALAPDRERDMNQSSRAEVNEFLTQLQGVSEAGVFVIAATNRPKLIDPAVLRSGRIDKLVFVPPPDLEARVAMFRLNLKGRPTEIGIDFAELGALTENFVSSDLTLIVDEAARSALVNDTRITSSILRDTIRKQRPSISVALLAEYEQVRRDIEQDGRQGDGGGKPRRIGF